MKDSKYIEEKKYLEDTMRDFLIKNNTHSLGNVDVSFGLIEQKPIFLNYFGEPVETIIDMIYIDDDEIMVENHFCSKYKYVDNEKKEDDCEFLENEETINDVSGFIEFSDDEMKEIMRLCGVDF